MKQVQVYAEKFVKEKSLYAQDRVQTETCLRYLDYITKHFISTMEGTIYFFLSLFWQCSQKSDSVNFHKSQPNCFCQVANTAA